MAVDQGAVLRNTYRKSLSAYNDAVKQANAEADELVEESGLSPNDEFTPELLAMLMDIERKHGVHQLRIALHRAENQLLEWSRPVLKNMAETTGRMAGIIFSEEEIDAVFVKARVNYSVKKRLLNICLQVPRS